MFEQLYDQIEAFVNNSSEYIILKDMNFRRQNNYSSYLTIFHVLNKQKGIQNIIDILNDLCKYHKVKSYEEASWEDDMYMTFKINKETYMLCDYIEGTIISK